MLENFQLAAIVRQHGDTRLLKIPLHQELQQILAGTWQVQLDAFIDGVQEIDFNAAYQPEEHERFSLDDFELPGWIDNENSQTADDLDPITEHEALLDSIKGIAAFARDDGAEVVLFQNFSRSHVIKPGRSLFLRGDTYATSERPGLTLENKLSALYLRVDSKLLFHNFRTVNTFLPLADFYEEASEGQIREVLEHKLLAPENADALATDTNQWFRKRFALLSDSGILDKYSAKQIQARSKGYDVEVHVSKGKIVFPAARGPAKKLLQFLNEELFRGAITETLYETNSKREAD